MGLSRVLILLIPSTKCCCLIGRQGWKPPPALPLRLFD